MSDLSNNNPFQGESFDPNIYIRKLCENTKIIIGSAVNVEFPPGWKDIVEELIKSLQNYSVTITHFHSTYSLLDVSFEVGTTTKEVYVWRAIYKARNDSAYICAICGQERGFRRRVIEILCETCNKNAAKLGKTQTWLDKY